MRNPNFMRNWLILLVFLGVIYFGVKGYYNHLLSPVSSAGEESAFVVKKGEGSSLIAQRLEDDHLIRSALAFKIRARLSGKGANIIPGDFKISPTQSVDQILQTLSSGPEDVWVTLLEGWRDEEVADKLNQELGINSDDFLKIAKQGYMFPDTYLFNKKATVATIAQTMRNNFDNKYSDDLQTKIKKLGLTPDQGVILASIVEREGRSDGVRQKVASILLKRLNIGMGLDVDATLQYALGYSDSEKTWWRSTITKADKGIDSPYNTYLHAGLPPTPICNPSLSSLTAVANADPTTPYLYYYHDSEGNSWYAKTLDEHNANVAAHP